MKQYLKLLVCFVLSVGLMISPALRVVSYADVNDLLMTDSNALMTMDLTDEDYGISLTSSLGTVVNTVDLNEVVCAVYLVNPETNGSYTLVKTPEILDGRLHVSLLDAGILDGYYICNFQFYLKNSTRGKNALPSSGTYEFSFDIASQFSYELNNCYIGTVRSIDNAALVKDTIVLNDYMTFSSGDLLVDGLVVKLYRVDTFNLVFNIDDYSKQKLRNLDVSAAFRFVLSSGDSDISVGADTSSQDYQSDVSSSLSGLSSSVDSMTEDLSSAAESLEYISSSQNLIIQGIDNVIMHISDQLYAFWDQLYNLIHEPTMAKMDEIIEAINNMDLEIEVNLDGLKQSIDNMSTAVQNKLQSVQDGINNKLQSVQETLTNGFNNSGINEDAAELDQSLQEYDEAEQNVLDQVNDSLNDFEFDGGFEEYANTIKVFSDFLQALYESSGGFKVVINLSLMLSIAGIVIGVYRFKEGG